MDLVRQLINLQNMGESLRNSIVSENTCKKISIQSLCSVYVLAIFIANQRRLKPVQGFA